MRKSAKSGPCYSNVSLIKRSLFQSKTRKLPYPEIILFTNNHWIKNESTSVEEIKMLVDLALNARKSFFQEDENGLWEVKNQTDDTLDPIINYIKRSLKPFQLKEIIKQDIMFNDEKELRHYLLGDIRFTELEGSTYWILSEWGLINDLVYNYMQEKNVEKANKREVFEVIVEEYGVDRELSIFFPEIDERFKTKRNTIQIELNQAGESETKAKVPDEVREEVARKSVRLLNWIAQQQGEFNVKQCIPVVFEIKANDPTFRIYYQAVEDFFQLLPTIIQLEKGRWITEQAAPSLETYNINNMNYQVHNSAPNINNVQELMKFSQNNPDHAEYLEDKTDKADKAENSTMISYYYSTISYYERVKGYLVLPGNYMSFLEAGDKKVGKICLNIEEFSYECWYTVKDNKIYCYGSGIFDFYSDFLIEPGHKIKITIEEQKNLGIHLMGTDERYALEQQRFLDIGKLAEERKRVNKSIFAIMCEVMATYPSGLHWIILLEKVSEIRSTTRSTISNLLSGNDCFVNIQDKKGYWRLEISKLSGYYTDENNQRTVQKIEPEEEFHTANKVREEKVTEIIKVGNIFPLHVGEDFEEDYELPPLEETFTRWAKKQRSIRYSTADEKAKNKEELIEILTHSYSKLFCQLAKSRRSHSLEYMDLVQESFLGLLKAIDKYNHVNSFAQYARLRIRQHLTRIITDRRLLIRIPAHLMEDLNKLEKLMTSTLVTKGRFPKDDEIQKTDIDYSIKRYLLQITIDFISFEQYWLYLKGPSGQNNYESKGSLLDPWVSEGLINYPLYELLLDKPLLDIEKELEILCTVDEEDTEIMWIEDDKIIENKLLAEELEKLLEGLSSREENVIRLRFGLNDDKTRTLEEIAKIFGLTRERIRQIEKKAMIKLKNASSKKEFEVYL